MHGQQNIRIRAVKAQTVNHRPLTEPRPVLVGFVVHAEAWEQSIPLSVSLQKFFILITFTATVN